jgi:hypothetical protein
VPYLTGNLLPAWLAAAELLVSLPPPNLIEAKGDMLWEILFQGDSIQARSCSFNQLVGG